MSKNNRYGRKLTSPPERYGWWNLPIAKLGVKILVRSLIEEALKGLEQNEDSNWIHNSLDGREFEEPDYKGPPMPKE